MKNIIITLLCFMAGLSAFSQSLSNNNSGEELDTSSTIIVSIPSIKKNDPVVRFELYDQKNFMKEPIQVARGKVRDGMVRVYFSGIEKGNYAVVCYVDKNNNIKMDTNESGEVVEKFAVSNNAKSLSKKPHWTTAQFTVSEPEKRIEINL